MTFFSVADSSFGLYKKSEYLQQQSINIKDARDIERVLNPCIELLQSCL